MDIWKNDIWKMARPTLVGT